MRNAMPVIKKHYLQKSEKIFLFGIGAAALILFIFILVQVYAFGVDDSYIFFRYAENLASGEGLRFNPGEQAGEGFTSWAWLLLLTLTQALGLNPVSASKMMGILFYLAGSGLLFILIYRMGEGSKKYKYYSGVLLASAFLVNMRVAAHSVGGMETSLYAFSILLLAYAVFTAVSPEKITPKLWFSVAAAGTWLFLVRPEGLAAAFIALAVIFWRHKKTAFRLNTCISIGLGLLVPVSLFFLMKTIVFGHPLPLSFSHKLIVRTHEYLAALNHLGSFIKDYLSLIIVIILTAAISLFIQIRLRQSSGQGKSGYFILYLILSFTLMILVYIPFYPVMNFLHRFYIPYLGLLVLITAAATGPLMERISTRLKPVLRLPLTAVYFILLIWFMNPNLTSVRNMTEDWKQLVNPIEYRAKLGSLMALLPRNVVVANTEMGVIPYYSGLTCIDMAGLTDPHIGRRGLSMEYLLDRGVDIIIFTRDVDQMSALEWEKFSYNFKDVFLSPEFIQRFQKIGAFQGWPSKNGRYYLYADSSSPHYNPIISWSRKNLIR